jgi:hypothetical protein
MNPLHLFPGPENGDTKVRAAQIPGKDEGGWFFHVSVSR